MHIFSKQAVDHNTRSQRAALPLTPLPVSHRCITSAIHSLYNYYLEILIRASIHTYENRHALILKYYSSFLQIIKLHHIKSSHSIILINKKYNKRIIYLSSICDMRRSYLNRHNTCDRIIKAPRWNTPKMK